jgi:hypothetical protein
MEADDPTADPNDELCIVTDPRVILSACRLVVSREVNLPSDMDILDVVPSPKQRQTLVWLTNIVTALLKEVHVLLGLGSLTVHVCKLYDCKEPSDPNPVKRITSGLEATVARNPTASRLP